MIMRNKGIAVRTILLLVVGVLVAGVLVYIVYRNFVASSLSESDCRARIVSWCTSCKIAMDSEGGTCPDTWGTGCEVGPSPGDDVKNCENDYYKASIKGCKDQKSFCQGFVPL